MRRNCSLDLRLEPSSFMAFDSFSSTATADSDDYNQSHQHSNCNNHGRRNFEGLHQGDREQINWSLGGGSAERDEQQLTIFYNGKICVCDVTELQARAIILLASREMVERMKPTSDAGSASRPEPLISPSLQSQLSPNTGLSMKRSLQRFLQKRKLRAQATSPYHQ